VAKLIFNAGSGRPEESPQQLGSILSEMQYQQILPEVYTVRPDSQLETVVHNAIKTGIKLIVVAGGNGAIERRTSKASIKTPKGSNHNRLSNLYTPAKINAQLR